MKADVFLDSNVILYAAANIEQQAAKKKAALRLIAETNFGTSVQVLGEFFDNARRKAKLAVPADTVAEIIHLLRSRPIVEETVLLFDRAIVLAERFGLRYYDAAILAAAEELDARTLYTEDLADGQQYGRIKAVNPFKGLA